MVGPLPRQPQHVEHRRAAGIDQRARVEMADLGLEIPAVRLAIGGEQRNPGQHLGLMLARVERVEHDQPRIVDPAVRIFEAGAEFRRQRHARGMAAQVDRPRRRQLPAAADMVIEEQPQPQQPLGPQAFDMGQDEAQRVDDVRRDLPQGLALGQRLAHQAELAVFEIAQAAVDQLGRGRGCAAGKIVRLEQQDLGPAPGSVTRNARAVDPAANHREVIDRAHQACSTCPWRRRNSLPRSL